MSTAIFDVATSLHQRVAELERIVVLADQILDKDKDEEAYNTLCRACCVLLASHLEGFLKDLSKSLIIDLNFYLKSFSKLPAAVKNTFCQKIAFYEGVANEEISLRAKQLMAFFENNSVTVDLHAFPYKETANKNPAGDVIDNALAKLGIPNALFSISGGKMELIFANDPSWNYMVRRDMRRFRSCVYGFPYRRLPVAYAFKYRPEKNEQSKAEKTIWHTFIGEVMRRRHSIAHGDTMSNEATTAQLRQDIGRMDVLMHGLMYSAVNHLLKGLETV